MKILVVEGDSGTMVYCEDCGALAGAPSKCLVYRSHSFMSTTVPVIYEHCGAIPGNPTKCEIYSSHSFVPVPNEKH